MPDQEDSLGGETFSGEEQQDPAEQNFPPITGFNRLS
jgi:hypothetical protein